MSATAIDSGKELEDEAQRGDRVAHGNLTSVITPGMVSERNNMSVTSYGYDHMRFLEPVHIGDTLPSLWEVTDKEEYDEIAGKASTYTAENQHREAI